jgi:glycosyltransferase involved in cell wall biosynthesis
MSFTVVLPIHNEASMLPYTLRSIFDIQADEIIFGVDRCTDESEDLILDAAKHLHHQHKGSLILRRFTEKDGDGWGFRPAYLRRELYRMSSNDVIINTSADLRLDPNISSYLNLISNNNYGLLSFHYYEVPWNIQCFERALITRFMPGFTGLLAFSKQAWLETEDIEELKKVKLGEDTHLQLAIKNRYHVKHIHSKSLHLRPNEEKSDHYLRGTIQWDRLHNPAWKTFLHSAVMLRPAVIAGWRHARRAEVAG